MAKKIRFPIKMKDGAEVRTLDELKESFDLESVLGYFTDGRLSTWLAGRYYDEKAEAIAALSADIPDLNAKLCEILEVEYQGDNDDTDLEYIKRRNEKMRILSAYADNKEILNNIDIVALDDHDLWYIRHKIEDRTFDTDKVYLYGAGYDYLIATDIKNVCYIGIGHEKPVITTNYDSLTSRYVFLDDYKDKYGITFKNIKYGISLHEEAVNYYNAGEYDREFVFEVLYQSAVDGDMYDQVRVGCMYEKGNGVSQDYTEAVKWYRKAAEQGYVIGQYNLGVMYENGYGIEQDKEKAVEWYREAAGQGYAHARSQLIRIILAIIQCGFGDMYRNGQVVSQDYAKAAECYRQAAEQGNADAQCNLAYLYRNGLGVKQDYAESLKWSLKAAEQGNACGQCDTGYMYDMGYGIEQDKAKAIEWYKKAAAQGDETAINNLKNLGVSI